MKIFRNPDVMWREEDEFMEQAYKGLDTGEDVAEIGTSILLHSGKMHSLNILGTEIWKLCDGKTLQEIVSSLREIFDVEEEVLIKDAGEFLQNMKEEGLVYEE
jgi:GeoRSP system PqqD family protein